MKAGPAVLVAFLLLGSDVWAQPQYPVPGESWEQVESASDPWSDDALRRARTTFDSLESAALMIVHRGRPVAMWGETDGEFFVASLRKSLLSALYGVYWDRGAIRLDRTLEEIGISDSDPELTAAEREATVEQLLLSRSGVFHPALYDAGWYAFMPARGSRRPGEFWIYNNWDFNALGTIFELETGETIHDAFLREIAEPLGMQDFTRDDVEYQDRRNLAERWQGNTSDHRLYLFRISARDLARLGLLYLNRGMWSGRRVLSQAWIDRSTEGVATDYPWPDGRFDTKYGYLWWVDEGEKRRLTLPGVTARLIIGSGARGQLLVIAPGYELVIAHTVAIRRGAGAWDQVSRRLLGAPAVSDAQFAELLAQILEAHPDSR